MARGDSVVFVQIPHEGKIPLRETAMHTRMRWYRNGSVRSARMEHQTGVLGIPLSLREVSFLAAARDMPPF